MDAKPHRRIVGKNWVRNGFGGTASFGLLFAAENINQQSLTTAHKIMRAVYFHVVLLIKDVRAKFF